MWTGLPDLPPDRPLLIAGPTASGKSALAAEIVARSGGVIVNADALQVYDCWRVLTARPSVAEEAALPHQLYGHVGRHDVWSAGHWLRAVAEIMQNGARPVIVGGTGLYFTALTAGLARIPETPPDIRAQGNRLRAEGGIAALLAGIDPQTAARIDRQNPARVQRAWEVQQATGRGLAAWQDETGPPLLPLSQCEPLILRPDRDWLARRIDLRFEAMMQDGALEEARAALPHWDPALPSSRAIGAPELIRHLRGETGLEEAVEAAKIATRQYAKRQRTWFRNRLKGWHLLDLP
ncbi:tRNA (adenosine(37)-N6)-dimethylallyltransferase MiaA [Szabonella alba]|uniref:tRNA dimethylallyltransferase n=1 Tax=Szabonella alba TaxID=2804194 RepID=A0A8K0XZS0_9RHOB|nr:tRNA (adenosine(37)-N6)-dimethylallyltransferase MiaA [Szabonella alba]MBL4917430.1 tRNA (adenosine(37)-N6)-dimethylallyltransferase MiaA [Szabonella alba]